MTCRQPTIATWIHLVLSLYTNTCRVTSPLEKMLCGTQFGCGWLQHAKPQSQHDPFSCFVLSPSCVACFCLAFLPVDNRRGHTTFAANIRPSSLWHHIDVILSLCISLQIWTLGDSTRCCHHYCGHLAAGSICILCTHLTGHSSTRSAIDFRR